MKRWMTVSVGNDSRLRLAGSVAGLLALAAPAWSQGGKPAAGSTPAPTARKSTVPLQRVPPIPPPPEPKDGKSVLKPYLFNNRQAIIFFEGKVAQKPDDQQSYRQLGRLYEKEAKLTGVFSYYEKAEAALRRSLELFPDDAHAKADLAAVLCTQHKFSEGLEIARKLNEDNPRDIDSLATIGDAQLELGQHAEAEATFKKLVQLAPVPEVDARISHLRELHGDVPEALRLMRKAEGNARKGGGVKRSAWYTARLGDIALGAGDLAGAEKYFNSVPQGVDPYHDATFGLGRVRLAQGRDAEALALFKKAVGIGGDPHMLVTLGDMYLAQGKKAQAEPLFAQMVKKTTGKAAYYRELCLFYADHNRNLPQALSLAEKDLEQRKDVFGYDALAWALYKNGRVEEAGKMIDEALHVGTQDARLFYHAGMIYHRLGDQGKAREYLSRSLKLNPRFSVLQTPELKKTLAALQGH